MSGYPYAEYPLRWDFSDDGVGTSFDVIELEGHLPDTYYVETINMVFDVASGVPTSFDWYLATDEAGENALTPLETGASWNVIINSVNSYVKGVTRTHRKQSGERLYLVIKVNSGTVDITGFAEGMVIRS